MVKCPFCSFDNEDGALFCEQCKSDLSAVPAAAPAAEAVEVVPVVADEVVAVEAVVMEAVVEPVDVMPVEVVQAVEAVAVVEEVVPIEVVPEPAPVAAPVAAAPPPPPPAAAAPPPPPPPAAPVAPPVAPAAAAAPAAAPAAGGVSCGPGAQPVFTVIRGQKVGMEFPVYPEYNYIGRADDKPVDIDLEDQEPPDRVWCSRQHAVIHFDEGAGVITVEDLNSSNGTYVNRQRVYPGQKKQLFVNDVVQIGTVHLKLKV